jgi:hypothetical protein
MNQLEACEAHETMAKKTRRLSVQPGFVQYLRTSSEEAQAPERSQGAQRRDIDQRLLRSCTLPDLGKYVDNFTGMSADRKLQGPVYLRSDGRLRKLVCSMPNANRERGGVAYYCVPSSSTNFLCHRIDAQISAHLQALQVDQALLPRLRERYRADLSRYSKDIGRERRVLQMRRRKLDDKELNLWRAFTEHGTRPHIYEQLACEIRDERDKVELLLERLEAEQQSTVADLDAAMRVLSEIGERYAQCTSETKRAILLQMVERVILTADGQVERIEWKPPFSYIQGLKDAQEGGRGTPGQPENERTSTESAGSLPGTSGAPMGLPGRETVPLRNGLAVPRSACWSAYTRSETSRKCRQRSRSVMP